MEVLVPSVFSAVAQMGACALGGGIEWSGSLRGGGAVGAGSGWAVARGGGDERLWRGVRRELVLGPLSMAGRAELERLPFGELVDRAQAVGITDVMLLMPANHQALIDAVLVLQGEQEQGQPAAAPQQSCCSLPAVVRTLAVPTAAVATAAVASTAHGKEALVEAWPTVAVFCEPVTHIPRHHPVYRVSLRRFSAAPLPCFHRHRTSVVSLVQSPPTHACVGMILLAFFGLSPLNEGYNWQKSDARLQRGR